MIGRRGILGALAGAPVAAKAAAAGLVTSPGAMSASLNNGAAKAMAGQAFGSSSLAALDRVGWARERLADAAKQLVGLGSDRGMRVADARRNVTRLDPDLADARAFSTATKIRLQAERDVERDLERQRGFMEREIASLRETIGL